MYKNFFLVLNKENKKKNKFLKGIFHLYLSVNSVENIDRNYILWYFHQHKLTMLST